MLSVAAILLAQAGGGWNGGRPPECGTASGRSANVWERAKSPELGRYCDLLASAASKLAGTTAMAEAALTAANEADGVLPGHAAPKALEGRAFAALGRPTEAIAAFGEATARDPRSLDDPPTLLAWARVLALTGHPDRSEDAFRALLPRASALSGADRATAAIEAGLVALSLGPPAIDTATASLREAVRAAQDEGEPLAVFGLALALDRAGALDESRALLADRGRLDVRAALSSTRAKELLAVAPGELPALLAIGLEGTDAAAARASWDDYLARNPGSPWEAHARAHAGKAAASSSRSRGAR